MCFLILKRLFRIIPQKQQVWGSIDPNPSLPFLASWCAVSLWSDSVPNWTGNIIPEPVTLRSRRSIRTMGSEKLINALEIIHYQFWLLYLHVSSRFQGVICKMARVQFVCLKLFWLHFYYGLQRIEINFTFIHRGV